MTVRAATVAAQNHIGFSPAFSRVWWRNQAPEIHGGVMAVPKLRQPAQASPEPQYTVRNGISGTRLTKPHATLIEADAAS